MSEYRFVEKTLLNQLARQHRQKANRAGPGIPKKGLIYFIRFNG